ncbi:MAG: PKD domain-containing protein [Gemmatimonadota bacterium]
MFRKIVRSSMVVLALGFAACDDVPTTPTAPDGETEFDPTFDVSLPPDGGTCPDVFYEQSRLLSNGTTVTWTSVLAGFDYSEGADYLADVNWSVDQGTVTFVGLTTRNGPNTWTPRRDVDGAMTPGAAGDGTLPVTVSMTPMHEAGEASDDDDDDEDDGDWAGKIGNGHFWLRVEIEGADGKVKRVKLGVNFHLEDPADGFGTNCPGDDPPVDPPVDPPAGNQLPIADAGPDETVTDSDGGGENVTLDGSGSTDPDGSIVSYLWTEGGGEIATGVNPTVLFAVGPHEVTLTVTDDAGDTDTDVVVITVDEPPAPGVSYAADIQPYFNTNCTVCHGSGSARGGVHLNNWDNVRAGADDGTPLVVPGNSNDGRAILLPQMRSGHQGTPHGTNILQQIADWIDAGALDN